MAAYYRQLTSFVVMNYSFRMLRQLVFVAGFVSVACTVSAQQAWFIFIQSENKQPFYARMDEKIYSSTAIGYITLAQLKDSTYKIVIGFPKNQYGEETFAIPVGKKDHGYQLRRNGGQEWVLYNWQTQNTIRPIRATQNQQLVGERKKDDGFANLMAAVVNDSSVLYTTVLKKAEPKETAPAVATITTTIDTAELKKDIAAVDSVEKPVTKEVVDEPESDTIVQQATALTEQEKDTIKTATSPDTVRVTIETNLADAKKDSVKQEKKPTVTKLQEQTKNGEKKLVFLDSGSIKPDTVTVIIPTEKPAEQPEKEEKVVVTPPVNKDTVIASISTDSSRPKAVMNTPIGTIDSAKTAGTTNKEQPKNDSAIVVSKPILTPGVKQSFATVNSDCTAFASDQDIDKLRVKMLAEKQISNRIFIAYKVFKVKCVTTRQVHALSELIDTDENRYKFFETAWPYVSDTAQFRQLVDVFTDDFFKTRFKTLVRMQ